MRTVITILLWPLVVATSVPQFRTSVSVVRLEVSVTDADGAVRGLSASDFVVLDNGMQQSISVEESADGPLDLVLVAPPLASVAYIAGDQVARVSSGLSSFFESVQEGDRLGVIVADAPPRLLQAPGTGPHTLTVQSFTGGPHSAPFDAIAAGLRLFGDSSQQKALVAFTNAADFRSIVTFEALAAHVRKLGPSLILVGAPVRVDDEVHVRASTSTGMSIGDSVTGVVSGFVFPETLTALAKRTGGLTVNLGDGDPAVLVREMVTWLRRRYVVSYMPPPAKGWHSVQVSVKRSNAKVAVRDGYFVE